MQFEAKHKKNVIIHPMKLICCFLILTMTVGFGIFSHSCRSSSAEKMANYIIEQIVDRNMYNFGTHEFRERGTIPSIKNELYFAQVLFASGEDGWIYHARLILEKYLGFQDLNENSKTYGSWYYKDLLGNEKLEFDMFLPIPLIQIWHFQDDLLGDRLKAQMKESFGHCVEGLIKNWYPSHTALHAIGHTNYHLMYVCDLLLLGEILRDTNAQNLAMSAFENWIDRTLENGITEFNSPTYLGVDIKALATIESLSNNPKAKMLAKNWIDFMLADMAIHLLEKDKPYLAGAKSRCYEVLAGTGMAIKTYYWCFGKEIADPSIDDILFAYISHKPHPALFSIQNQTNRQGFIFKSRWGLESWETRQTWFGNDFIVGTSGKSYGSQDRVLVIDRKDKKWPFSMTQVIQINDHPYELPRMGGGSGRNHPKLPIFINHEGNKLIEVIDLSMPQAQMESLEKLSLSFVLPVKNGVIVPMDVSFPIGMDFDTPFGIIADNDMIFIRATIVGHKVDNKHFRQFVTSGIQIFEKNILSRRDEDKPVKLYLVLCAEIVEDMGTNYRAHFEKLCKAPFKVELKGTILHASYKDLKLEYETINRKPLSVPNILVTETADSPWTCLNRKKGEFYILDEKIRLKIQ
jgi:hypothetical protein